MKKVIGIDIGGTNLRFGVVDHNGNLEHFEKKSSGSLVSDNAVENLKNEILRYMDTYQLNKEELAITIGVPSAVSKDKSFIYSSPNLKGLENMDLGHLLRDALQMPVFVDRDVNYLLMNDIKNFDIDPDRDKTVRYVSWHWLWKCRVYKWQSSLRKAWGCRRAWSYST